MRITFLGTSAGTPTRERNVTSQALQFDDGRIWLLDCGEATQHQLLRAGLKPGRIERILITHLHGDHCFGLPGMLASMAIHGRAGEPVEIIGPPGVRELVEVANRVSATRLPYALAIRELREAGPIAGDRHWSVSAWPLKHRVPCWGYCLQEPTRSGRFHPERALALGVRPGPDFGRLQDGHDLMLPDGRTVRPDEVCDPPRRGRLAVLLGDTCNSDALLKAATGCDLLVHEVTYDAGREAKAIEWGHSTSQMAGRFAAAAQAKTLIITHFSSRFDDDSPLTVADLVAETQSHCPGTTVLAAEDLFSFSVPKVE